MRLLSTSLAVTFYLLNMLAIAPASAQHASATSKASSQVEFSDVTALPSRTPDQVIRYGGHEAQFIEFWHAEGDDTAAPAVVMVHGGCWLNAFGVDHTRGAATALAEQGFAVWSVEYRRLGDEGGGWPNSRDDIVDAIDMLQTLEPANIDLNQIIVAGHSAGGHLALHAVERTQIRPALTIGLAAITDPVAYSAGTGSCQRAGAEFLATTSTRDTFNVSVSPYSSLARVLFYAQADTIVDAAQAEMGITQAVMVENAGHFDFIHPDTLAWDLWLQHIQNAIDE